jgi:hypothetical protein
VGALAPTLGVSTRTFPTPALMQFKFRLWHVCVAALAIGVVAVASFLATPSTAEYLHRQPFDSVTWRQSLTTEATEPIRLRMVDDLLQRYSMVGKTRSEINALLGIPPKTNYFREYEYVYWLGPERGFMSIDSEWLGLQFDESGRVTIAKILRD